MKAIFALIALFFIFSLVAKSALAVSVTINSFPSTITDDPFNITASISGASAGTNYLRIDLFKDQTTSYFGETFNNSDWYGGSTYSQYLPITIQSGVIWSGSIQGRVGSPTQTQYDGGGIYKIRLRRYTSGGGNTASEANNSAVVVSISIPTSTPTPTDVPTPTLEPTSTPIPTNTPIPTKLTTKTPTPKPKLTTAVSNLTPIASTAQVLGDTTQENLSTEAIGNNTKVKSISTGISIGKIFILLGIIFLILCGIVVFWYNKIALFNKFIKHET